MARNSDSLSDSFGTDESDGWLGGLVADEDNFDRHTLWRLGLWGVAAVGAVTLGILSGQLPVNAQRTQLAAADLTGRARQVEASVHDNQLEARRLSAAIDTLNSDRDRLFSRLSAIEQGLDVVTGSIKKADEKKADEKPAAAITPWPDAPTARIIESAPFPIAAPPSAPPQTTTVAAVAPTEPERAVTTPPAPAQAASAETPAPAAAAEPTAAPPPVIQAMPIPEPQAAPDEQKATEETPIAVAEFGVDLGPANSIGGLRALWRGLVKSHRPQLEGLRPLIAVQERRNGLGLQLRLIAGPIKDAAAAARICAVLDNANRDCKTATYDGQRLSIAAETEERAAPAPATRPPKPRRSSRVRQPKLEVQQQAETERRSTLSTVLGIR
jgi:hypothetical protein